LVVNPILECTLNHKIADWRERSKGLQTAMRSKPQPGPFRLSGLMRQEMGLSQERLHVSLQLASALNYLHSVGLVFRDLKPQNVGFDRHGTVKLFDFGLAKHLDPRRLVNKDDQDDDTDKSCSRDGRRCLYKMTGSTGSLRYMAPEVSRNEPYNEMVDVYSFGILLWEIITLDRAYRHMDRDMHLMHVSYGKQRPSLRPFDDQPMDSSPSLLDPYMKFLLEYCWDDNLHKRPSMDQVHAVLLDQTDILNSTLGTTTSVTKSQHKSLGSIHMINKEQLQESSPTPPTQVSRKPSPSRAKAA
jgi:serine/threonine protein kinase